VEDVALGLPASGAAVLCRTTHEARCLRGLIAAEGVPVQDLEQYDGSAVEAVKVGTVKRAKGLEFQRVYLPRVDGYMTADGSGEPERVQRERRELFVAMTRARDGLWLSRVDPG
jgi:superfamily I DNA/RNA helicase